MLAWKFVNKDLILSKPIDTSLKKVSLTSRIVRLTKADPDI